MLFPLGVLIATLAAGNTSPICHNGKPLPVASETGYWSLHEEYGKEAVRVYDTYLRMTSYFKPYDVADFARLHRLTRFFRFAWNHAMDAFIADGLLTQPLNQNDVLGFCRSIQEFEVYIQAEWCLSVMLLSQTIGEVSQSLVEALAVVGATPQNRTQAISNNLANNTRAVDEFSYLYISQNDKPFNVISVNNPFDDAYTLYRTSELIPSSDFCAYLKELVHKIKFKATPLAADPLSGRHHLLTLHGCLEDVVILDAEVNGELDVLEVESCMELPWLSGATDGRGSPAKIVLVPVNPAVPPPLLAFPVSLNVTSDERSSDVRSACSLAALVHNLPPLYVYHSFQSSLNSSFAVLVRRDFGDDPGFLAERLVADWLVGWAHHPLRLFLHDGLRLKVCLDHEVLANPEMSLFAKAEVVRAWLGDFARIEVPGGQPSGDSDGVVTSEQLTVELAATAARTCVTVHRRAVVKDEADATHVEVKEWRDCAQACAKQDDCKTWTFDPLDGGSCWYWLDKEPEFIVDEKFWLTGNWSCSIQAAKARRLLELESPADVNGRYVDLRQKEKLLTAFVHPGVPSLHYVLGNRGRCANNGECECFPPYRGPLCAHLDVGKHDAEREYKAVLHYLTSDSDTDVFELKNSLSRLYEYFNKEADYPVVVFHDGLSPSHRKEIAEASANRVWFAFVEDFVSVPAWITNNPKYNSRLSDIRWSLGYRGMCRFRSGPIFDQPILNDVDYAMTLDTDGYLPDFVQEDPIAKMHAANGVYSYSHILDDQPAAVEHFFEHVLMFMRDRGINATALPLLDPFMSEGKWNMRLYMNDIEVKKLAWFRGPQYRDFFEYLDSFGGWWLHRWGDHAVRTFAIGMWLTQDRLVNMDIPYGHQSYCKCARKNFVCVRQFQLDHSPAGNDNKFFVCIEP